MALFEEEWAAFKVKFNKSYATEEEEKNRMKIYLGNKKRIEEHNSKYEKGEVTFSMGVNQFTDLEEHEFKVMLGARPRP